ncbi:TIGR00282 family metallophosphoesterase [Armatimonas sp.]|uniref:TIGR00282 family metallophosphoesterase n=1 Tax=Armatimonas sp. TaxID=1872638 RepID=UPI00286C4F68|nr:TIGR00282 family metallophosphoesterase [Armatimonas sp.]
MRILFLGDIVGKPGRDAVVGLLPELRAEFAPELVIANAENAAGGRGVTRPIVRALRASGVDVITTGNHVWAKTDELDLLDDEPCVLRPANYPPGSPGRGWGLFRTKKGTLIGVANLIGRALMEPVDDPFRAADAIIAQVLEQTPLLFIDFHAETTSEKTAFGWHCAGRASVVVGTHTHVQTADERILPGGTAYITDAGMCGPEDSVIGMDIEAALARFKTQLPHRLQVADSYGTLCGVVVDLDESTGKAQSIQRLRRSEVDTQAASSSRA